MGEGRFEPRFDQNFKELMMDSRVFSRVAGAFVPELEEADPEAIGLMWARGDIDPINTELVTPGSSGMRADLLYRIRMANLE